MIRLRAVVEKTGWSGKDFGVSVRREWVSIKNGGNVFILYD